LKCFSLDTLSRGQRPEWQANSLHSCTPRSLHLPPPHTHTISPQFAEIVIAARELSVTHFADTLADFPTKTHRFEPSPPSLDNLPPNRPAFPAPLPKSIHRAPASANIATALSLEACARTGKQGKGRRLPCGKRFPHRGPAPEAGRRRYAT